eukprot:TRINITY_DN5248_c0_g1_i2.p1 TRINITY_DN5248_c0_g1~~TRINITY_DN5248_c0_g1_i2.p1  ORF type:complete len:305 (+),score=48.61 TRINITY_DN5248_c0_g1_i2:330-1244(+)
MEFELEIRRFLDHAKIVQQLSDSIGTAEDCKEARLELDRAREKTKEEDIALSTKFKEYTRDVNLRGDANFKRLEPLYQSWAERWRLIYKESFVREAKHPLKSTASSKASSLSSPIPAKPDKSHQAPSSRSFSPPKPNEGPSERKITSLETKKYSSKDEIMREIVQERNREISTLKDDLVEVADVFKVTANLVRQHGTTLDAIETHLDEVQTETRKSMNVIAEAARENANMSAWPISGAAIGGIVLGGIGSFMGPVGLIAGKIIRASSPYLMQVARPERLWDVTWATLLDNFSWTWWTKRFLRDN